MSRWVWGQLSDSTISPISMSSDSLTFSPVSEIVLTPQGPRVITKVIPTSTTITPTIATFIPTTTIFTPIEIDTGLNTSYLAQKEMTHYLLYRILDKWLYEDDLCYLLKYLKIKDGKITQIKNKSEYQNVKICDEKIEDIEKKIDYIEENILGMTEMKKILQRLVEDYGFKWYDLSSRENVVVEATEKFLKKKLKPNSD